MPKTKKTQNFNTYSNNAALLFDATGRRKQGTLNCRA